MGDLLAVVVVVGWSAAAAALVDVRLYDGYAVAASAAMLGAAAWFLRWAPPPGREPFRLLGFFVCGQAFLSSGLSIISKMDTAPLMVAPRQEDFSFAVEATLVFALMFLFGALLTAPRAGEHLPSNSGPTAGPTRLTGLVVAVIGTALSINFALTTTIDSVGRFGTLPLVLFNMGAFAPMLAAQSVITGRNRHWALGIVLAGQALITFYTSMLGVVVLTMRDVLLARVYLRKSVPIWFIGAMIGIMVALNPAKSLFRTALAKSGGTTATIDLAQATSLWTDAVETTWSTRHRGASRGSDVEATSRRLDYNWLAAHVHRTVPHRVGYQMGETYAIIPTMLIPRAINPDKPNSAWYARGQWLVKLGIQDRRTFELAAISLPAPAEAYWNFGWFGVFFVPLLLGSGVGLMLRVAPKDPVARAGYIVLLAASLGQFLDMVVWIVPSFVSVGAAGVLLALYSRIGRRRSSAPTGEPRNTDRLLDDPGAPVAET